MKYNYLNGVQKSMSKKVTAVLASLILLVTPMFNTVSALLPVAAQAANEPVVSNVDAYYASGSGYTGIGVDFSTININEAQGKKADKLELILHGGSFTSYSIKAGPTLLNNLNASTGEFSSTGNIIVTGSRTSSSNSWETMNGTWTGASRPTSVEVRVTLEGESTPITKTDTTIVDNSGNTQASVFAAVPTVSNVGAGYVKKTDSGDTYTGIYVEFDIANVSNAQSIEVRINRDGGAAPYSMSVTPSRLLEINTNAASAKIQRGGTVIITGSHQSGSWTPQTGTWSGPSRPASVDVIVTLSDGTTKLISSTTTIANNEATPDVVFPGPVANIDSGETFATIQAAIDDSDTQTGHTISTEAGAYSEAVNVTKSVTIKGAQSGVDARTRATSDESIINGGFTITSPNVTIDGFTFNGSISAVEFNTAGTTVKNNIVSSSSVEGSFRTEHISTVASNTVISQNKFTSGDVDIRYLGNKNIKASGIVIENNRSSNPRTFLVLNNTEGADVTGNAVSSATGTAIALQGGNKDLSITRNNIQGARNPITLDKQYITGGIGYSKNSNVTVQYNNLLGINDANSYSRVQKDAVEGDVLVNMTKNFWGAPEGPYDLNNDVSNPKTNSLQPSFEYGGVRQYIDYSSWLCQPFGVKDSKLADANGSCVDTVAPTVPTAKLFDSNNNERPHTGWTQTKNFKFQLSTPVEDETTGYQVRYWNDIDGSIYKGENKAWTTNVGASGVYSDQFTQNEGTHYFSFRARDEAGNWSAYSNAFKIGFDKTNPVIDVTNLHEGDVIKPNANGKIVIRGNFKDEVSGANYAQIQLVYKGNDKGVVTKHGTVVDGILAEFDASSLIDGSEYYVSYGAADGAGNVTEKKIINFTLDKTLPAITNGTITPNNVKNTDSPTINADVNGTGSNVASAQYRIHTKAGVEVSGFSWVDMVAKNAPFDKEFESITATMNLAGLVDGEYIARIRAFDVAGNKKSGADVAFTVDNTAPVITITSQTSTSATPTITGNVSGAPDSVTVLINGIPYTATLDANGNFSVTTNETFANGPYSIVVNAKDASGNNAITQTQTLTVAIPPVGGGSSENEEQTTPNNGSGQGNTSGSPVAPSSQPSRFVANSIPTTTSRIGLTPARGFGLINSGATDNTATGTPADAQTPTDTNTDVLGANDFAKTDSDSDILGESDNAKDGSVYELFGIAWYWIVAAAAALLFAGWWFLAAKRRKKADNSV
jgi:hypothetical protein